jgi:hypothetical protein
MYSDDLAKAIAIMVERGIYENCNVCVDENYTIKEIAELAIKENNLNVSVNFDGGVDGQMRKEASNQKFKALHPDFEFTPLAKGLKIVYDKISK